MNERIAALIDKMNYSGLIYQAGDYEMSVTGRDLEYLAELIVRECITVINQPNGVGDDDVIRITKDVEKHFGVEE